jgi:hypothetical protein
LDVETIAGSHGRLSTLTELRQDVEGREGIAYGR